MTDTALRSKTRFTRRLLPPLAACLFLGALLQGCVTVTNDSLAQNRDPEKATRIYVEAGMRYLQARNMASANRTLKRAEELSPDDPAVNNALALFYGVEGDDDLAEKHFKRAIAADAEFSQARNNYAVFLYEHERYRDAADQLEKVVKDYLYPKRYAAFENLGLCYLKLEQWDEARQAFNRALQIDPKLPGPLLALAEIYLVQDDAALAAQYLAQHEAMSRPSAAALWTGIRIQRKLGDRDKLASYELALKNMFPKSAEYQAFKDSK